MLRQGWGGEGLEWRYVQAGERFGGQVLCVFFGHLPAEIFKAISLCSFCRGCLKENDLSTVTGRGVDRKYMYTYIYIYIDRTMIFRGDFTTQKFSPSAGAAAPRTKVFQGPIR